MDLDQHLEKHFKETYKTLVKIFKYRTDNNEADAEDIIMEAYARALKYKSSFDSSKEFSFWFNRIVINAYKDWKREKFNGSPHEELIEDKIEPVEKSEIREELLKHILSKIEEIDNEIHKEVISLNIIEGFKLKEIVQITNLKYKNVDIIIQRFKNKLKENHD